jgi:hypothetical protein
MYFRFSRYEESEEDLLDPARMTRSWQPGHDAPGVSAALELSHLLQWAIDHRAVLDDSYLVVMEGEELGHDLDYVENSVEIYRVRPTGLVDQVEVNPESIIAIAEKYDNPGPMLMMHIMQQTNELRRMNDF